MALLMHRTKGHCRNCAANIYPLPALTTTKCLDKIETTENDTTIEIFKDFDF